MLSDAGAKHTFASGGLKQGAMGRALDVPVFKIHVGIWIPSKIDSQMRAGVPIGLDALF